MFPVHEELIKKYSNLEDKATNYKQRNEMSWLSQLIVQSYEANIPAKTNLIPRWPGDVRNFHQADDTIIWKFIQNYNFPFKKCVGWV